MYSRNFFYISRHYTAMNKCQRTKIEKKNASHGNHENRKKMQFLWQN